MDQYFKRDLITLAAIVFALLTVILGVRLTGINQADHVRHPEIQAMAQGLLDDRARLREAFGEFSDAATHYRELGRDWREIVAENIRREMAR